MNIAVREQDEYIEGDQRFVITAFEAFYGLTVLTKLQDTLFSGFSAPPEVVREVIIKSTSLNGSQITDKNFNVIFSKKYKLMMNLFMKIVKFNFEDLMQDEEENSPNVEGDTSDQQ